MKNKVFKTCVFSRDSWECDWKDETGRINVCRTSIGYLFDVPISSHSMTLRFSRKAMSKDSVRIQLKEEAVGAGLYRFRVKWKLTDTDSLEYSYSKGLWLDIFYNFFGMLRDAVLDLTGKSLTMEPVTLYLECHIEDES